MATIAVALIAAGPAQADPAASQSNCTKIFTQQDQRQFARALYQRPTLTRKGLHRNERLRVCQNSLTARRNALKFTRRHRRLRAQRLSLTPYCASGSCWAIPAYIVSCESHGNFRARNSVSTAGGAYQILDSTWYAHGGSRYNDSHPAAVAPPSEQHKVAARIWRSGGPSQWACA